MNPKNVSAAIEAAKKLRNWGASVLERQEVGAGLRSSFPTGRSRASRSRGYISAKTADYLDVENAIRAYAPEEAGVGSDSIKNIFLLPRLLVWRFAHGKSTDDFIETEGFTPSAERLQLYDDLVAGFVRFIRLSLEGAVVAEVVIKSDNNDKNDDVLCEDRR